MRSSVLVPAALAMGVLAFPQPLDRRGVVVTETEVVVTTVVVYVTADYVDPTSTSLSISSATAQELKATSSATSLTPAAHSSNREPTPSDGPAAEREAQVSSVQVLNIPRPRPTRTPYPRPEPAPQPSPRPSRSRSSSVKIPVPQPTTSPVPAAPSAPSKDHLSGADQAYLSSGPEYQAAVLYHHNAARANHDAAPLTWDADCEANARIAARKCTFAHYIPDNVREGQNLFTVSGDAFNVTAGITTSWYQGELEPMLPWFGQNDIPDEVFHSVGHLTQLLWKGTTKVGCVSLDCGGSMIVGGASSNMNKYTVCNYSPPGNIGGKYAANVAAPLSRTNLGGWAD